MTQNMRLDVQINLYGPQSGTRLGINEAVDLEEMSFRQIARLLEAFHIIAEAVKETRNLNINGEEIGYR